MTADIIATQLYATRLVSEANSRDNHFKKARRVAEQRRVACWVLRRFERPGVDVPLVVKITRIGPKDLDTDNLASSAKAVRDGVADWLGRKGGDGASSGVRWVYAQRRAAKRGEYAVEIEIRKDEDHG